MAIVFHEGAHFYAVDSVLKTQITHYCWIACFINRKYKTKIKQLTPTSFPIFPQYEVLVTLADIGIISINTNMFTAMVN